MIDICFPSISESKGAENFCENVAGIEDVAVEGLEMEALK